MKHFFDVLGVRLSLEGPDEIVRPVAFAYRRFEVEPGTGFLAVQLLDNRIRVGDRIVPIVEGLGVQLQLYQHFVSTLMDTIESHAVLHAAALAAPDARAVVLAAPSGHGKSSLTLELVRRGLRFMSDDFAPLDLAQRTVAPYPRTVAMIPGQASPVPEPFRSAASKPETPEMFGKRLIDIGQVLGETSVVQQPLELGRVILLSASLGDDETRPQSTRLEMAGLAQHAEEIDAVLQATEGAQILAGWDQPGLRLWQVELQHAARPTAELSDLLDSDRVVYFEKYWCARPDFEAEPAALRIRRRETAEHLGRELLNRRGGGRLLARYDGSVPALFFDLAGALREVDCYRVRVGEYQRTADLIEKLASGGQPD